MVSSFIALAAAHAAIQPPSANSAPPPPPPPAAGAAAAPRQIGGAILHEDYPAAALRAGEQGTTAFTVTVAPDGSPAACRVTESSGSETLDQASCELVTRRFRYEPARDASGKAVTGEVIRRITWVLPEDSPDLPTTTPLLSFSAGELHVTLGGQPDERPRCAVDTVGEAFQSRASLSCFGHQRVAAAELAGEPYRVVTVQRLQPEGATPIPRSAAPPGDLMGSVSALIEVDDKGRVTQCTPVDTRVSMPVSAGHICDALFYGMPLFQPAEGATRRAAYHIDVYKIEPVRQPAT